MILLDWCQQISEKFLSIETWEKTLKASGSQLNLFESPILLVCTPPDVENGWTDFEMIMIPAGAKVNVYCYEGFKNMGYGQLTCGTFGEIEGSARCEEIARK